MNILPGWFPSVTATAVAGALTLSYFASASSAAATINYPASIQAGDLIVLFDSATEYSSGYTTLVIPSGYTAITTFDYNYTITYLRTAVSYKIANGSETGSVTGMNATSNAKAMLVFRGSSAISSITSVPIGTNITSLDPASINVTASGGTPPLIVFGYFRGESSPTVTFSPTQDGSVASVYTQARYKIYNASPADTTVDINDTGNINFDCGFYLAAA